MSEVGGGFPLLRTIYQNTANFQAARVRNQSVDKFGFSAPPTKVGG
jgi:hypothetical protein